MYYCNSRYYNPLWCRWLNADSVNYLIPTDINSTNLYQYCANNPIMNVDFSGNMPKWVKQTISFVTGVFCGPVASCGTSLTLEIIDNKETLKQIHYNRNVFNTNLPTEKPSDNDPVWEVADAKYHQFSSKDNNNVKYVSDDGREIVYDEQGVVITDPRDIGTYNFCTHEENSVFHGMLDVLPWLVWGNSEEDTTSIIDRLFVFLSF